MDLINPVPRSLLIVDDEPYVRQSLYYFFEDHEWEVFSVDSGEAALEALRENPCNAAIVDIRMGGMDGETFIRKASKAYPDMFFVVCTGSPEYGISDDLSDNTQVADTVFSKPVARIEDLEETLISLLKRPEK